MCARHPRIARKAGAVATGRAANKVSRLAPELVVRDATERSEVYPTPWLDPPRGSLAPGRERLGC